MNWRFHKYSGAGNTFLILDDRKCSFPLDLVSFFCRSSGKKPVDGMILWRFSTRGDARMDYYNRDGSFAKMCGNGLRCFVHFLYEKGLTLVRNIEVCDNLLKVEGLPPRISVFLQDPQILFWNITLYNTLFYVVDTGVPHAVSFFKDPVDVVKKGRAIRKHPHFFPQGVNVNFVWVQNREEIVIRTYERGVEAETLACSTGAVACAFVAHRLGFTSDRVRVVTQSGVKLEINLKEGNVVTGPSEFLGVWQLSN